eukprot:SAG31_NODE_4796_length_2952_cov_12.871714_4_plen_170_part_00
MSKSSFNSQSTSFHRSAFAGASGAMKGRVSHKDPFITSAGGTKTYVYDTCQASADAKKREARRAIKELNNARKTVVARAFKKLDKDGSGEITIDDVRGVYNARMHPEVIKGNMTEDEVLMQFLARFEQHSEQKDGIVTFKEFLNYYKHVGADIPNDEYFILMVSQAWRL